MMERSCKCLALQIQMLLLLFLFMATLAEQTPNLITDQSALLSLKTYITSDPFEFLSNNWTVNSSVCDWIGVTCGLRHRRVRVVNLFNMSLIGTIPPNLGNLSFLAYLDLSMNSFHGSLPPELASLRRLKFLDFGFNAVSGVFPTWIGSLSELLYLSMANNSFTGFIPLSVSNLSKLETLHLSSNSLEGIVPAEIGKLYHLQFLGIQDNYLLGSLPPEIFNISTLETISLAQNTLSGDLPNTICGRFSSLKQLNLPANLFSGEIPLNLSHCSKLEFLDLSNNNFRAANIPKEIGNLQELQFLGLRRNNLKGVIRREIGNLTMLKILTLSENNLKGDIPLELGKLYNVEEIYMHSNDLSGHIPGGIYNLSMIRNMNFGNNSLFGKLPSNIGFDLPNLESLYLFENHFSGLMPPSISNSSKLMNLELAYNNFTGSIPESLGDLNHLQFLNLAGNQFSGSQILDFFTFLSKCKELTSLLVNDNPLNGFLPISIGNLSKSIEVIKAENCRIKGSIPSGIANLTHLVRLSLKGNQLTGSVQASIQDLQGLDLSDNKLSGLVPGNLCGMQKLSELNLEANQISGSVPDCFGNITSLRMLFLGSNRLTSRIPTRLWNLKDILVLDLSSNYFLGSLSPKIINLEHAFTIYLSNNSFSGDVPSTIGDLKSLEYLDLSLNKFQGSIPESLGMIKDMKYLDLSHNMLSGTIPRSLENLKYLKIFNVSFNKLRGEIPSKGPFENLTSQSFISNPALCGEPRFNVSLCPPSKEMRKRTLHHHIFLLLAILTPVLAVITVILVYLRCSKKDKLVTNEIDSRSMITPERISYHELVYATNRFDESNLIGTGSFGTVYKGMLNDGRVVAVKIFNLQEERSFKSFEEECQVLCNIRHRNLTKVISSCSSLDFKALILEYMPNGSLEKWLYSHNYFLDIMQRLNIMIDVACALQYLHFGNPIRIVHCDLKPSNVLLDQDMVAHICDFGIAKLLDQDQSKAYTQSQATFGYIAPEYGLEGLVSTKGDVYSYGILLMEVFTRKRPIDEMFNEGLSLRDWVKNSASDAFAEVIDANLLKDIVEEYSPQKFKCLSSIFELALNCSIESPRDRRTNMGDVLVVLEKIRHQFHQYHRRKA